MYVAKLPIHYRTKDGDVTIKSGDTIPDFEAWGLHAQRAYLSLGHVEKRADETPAPQPAAVEKPKKKSKKK